MIKDGKANGNDNVNLLTLENQKVFVLVLEYKQVRVISTSYRLLQLLESRFMAFADSAVALL